MLFDHPFNKENLDSYLRELAKDYRRKNGKSMPVEIILIGGAAVVINYGFRESTYDMDAIIEASSSIKDSINYIGDKHGLPNGWLNADFMKTTSYTPKIILYSRFYKTFSNVINVRTISGEYLIVMKLMSGRQYKYDLSDVIGVLWEHKKAGNPINMNSIIKSAEDMYGAYEKLPDISRMFIEKAIENNEYEELYNKVRQTEIENKSLLLKFQEDYPDALKNDNVNDIIASVRKKLH